MYRHINLSVALLLMASTASYIAVAQDETDALRYSYLSAQGTARSMGFGNALGSVGGDFSSLSVNPAGIGIYRSSEFMFTPTIKFNGVNGSYLGTSTDDNKTRFNFGNVGAVFTSVPRGKRAQRSSWKAVSFGIGINRVADFNRNYSYGGNNTESSISLAYESDANEYGDVTSTDGSANTPGQIGYYSFLLDTFGGRYYSVVPVGYTGAPGVRQMRSVKERGGISDIAISLGGNYEEKFMIGATLGLPSVRYVREVDYTETDLSNDPNNYFSSLNYKDALTTTGLGVNLKLGFIYKPTDAVRFGAAIHTPTYFGLTDVYDRSLTTNTETLKAELGYTDGPVTIINNNPNNPNYFPTSTYEYGMTTPWRGILSATGMLGKFGFITADYEYVNYKSARYHFEDYFAANEKLLNDVIKNTYQGASNIRIGAEGRFDIVMVRLGFGYYGSPYKNYSGGSRMDLSGGIGFRFDNFFTDIAYVRSEYKNPEIPYSTGFATIAAPVATLKNTLNNIALTIGWKF